MKLILNILWFIIFPLLWMFSGLAMEHVLKIQSYQAYAIFGALGTGVCILGFELIGKIKI